MQVANRKLEIASVHLSAVNCELFSQQTQHQQQQQHPFNSPLSGTTQLSRYHKGKTNLDFTEARDSKWQWHQLRHMQMCTSPQTDTNTQNTLKISPGHS